MNKLGNVSNEQFSKIIVGTNVKYVVCIFICSNKVITNFNNILASNGSCLKTGNIDGKFKERMITNWKGDIDQIWTERKLNKQMMRLNEAKLNAHQSDENAWYAN